MTIQNNKNNTWQWQSLQRGRTQNIPSSAVRWLLLGQLLCMVAQLPMTRDLFFSYLLVLSLNTYFSLTNRSKQSARFLLFLKSLVTVSLRFFFLNPGPPIFDTPGTGVAKTTTNRWVQWCQLSATSRLPLPLNQSQPRTRCMTEAGKMSHQAAHCTGVGGQIS